MYPNALASFDRCDVGRVYIPRCFCLPRKNAEQFFSREVKKKRLHPRAPRSIVELYHRCAPDERDRATMATIEVTFPSDGPPGKILKWRVRSDTMVAAGRILLLYQNATPTADDEQTKEPERKLRATNFGRVKRLLAKEGDVVQPGYASFSQSSFGW